MRAIAMFLLFAPVACTQTRSYVGLEVEKVRPGSRVLLMPCDIVLSELTTGGLLEPNAEWTAKGEANMAAAIEEILAEKKVSLAPFAKAPGASDDPATQLLKLHAAVGQTILAYKYGGVLPTKRNTFDWTLGEGARMLGGSGCADYALFVYLRDSFTSSGRAALIIFAAVMGVGVQGGSQSGFASLVDLRTGRVVWFNVMSSSVGDLRKPESAKGAAQSLLKKAPL